MQGIILRAGISVLKVRAPGAAAGFAEVVRAQACCLVELDRRDAAVALSEPLFRHCDPMAYYLVCFLARAGEVRQALDMLDEVVEAGWSHAPLLRHDPDIDPLRRERRFRRIERRIEMH